MLKIVGIDLRPTARQREGVVTSAIRSIEALHGCQVGECCSKILAAVNCRLVLYDCRDGLNKKVAYAPNLKDRMVARAVDHEVDLSADAANSVDHKPGRDAVPVRQEPPQVSRDDLFPSATTLAWGEVERFLRNPGDVLADFESEANDGSNRATGEAERVTIGRALEALSNQRRKV